METPRVPAARGEPAMTVTLHNGRPGVIVVTGEADLVGVGPLSEAVDHALSQHPHLVLDLAGVTFADSTFLNTLLRARLLAQENEGSVHLLAPSTVVRHLLKLTGAEVFFPVLTSE
ncbi:STAS domain-containing protein [Streptomyces niveus]|uniref:STAS domain-containing protein n=1 Tax=Streptomyces niveus TaxID=193462 RepID=UPI00341CA2B1